MTKIMFPINLQLCRTVIVITVSLGQKTVQNKLAAGNRTTRWQFRHKDKVV